MGSHRVGHDWSDLAAAAAAAAIPAEDLDEEKEMSLLLNRSEQGITEFLKDVKHVIPNFKYQTSWVEK